MASARRELQLDVDAAAHAQGNEYFQALVRDFARQAARDVVKHLLPNAYTANRGVGRLKGPLHPDKRIRTGKRKRGGEPGEGDDADRPATAVPPDLRGLGSTTAGSSASPSIRASPDSRHPPKGLVLSTLWPLLPAQLPYQPDAPTLAEALEDTANQLMRARSLAFPPSRPGLRQKYIRVPVDIEAVRREGAWVTERDVADEPARAQGKRPMPRTQDWRGSVGVQQHHMSNSEQDSATERKSQYGTGSSLDGFTSDSDGMDESPERQPPFVPARVSPNPSSVLSVTTRAAPLDDLNDQDQEDPEAVLPPRLAQELTEWLNGILVRLAEATPDVTGTEFAQLKPMDWTAVVDAVAASSTADLRIALRAERKLGPIYGVRDPNRRDVLIARHQSIQSAAVTAQALEDRLCESSTGTHALLRPRHLPAGPFRPLGPPKRRKKYQRRTKAEQGGIGVSAETGADASPPGS